MPSFIKVFQETVIECITKGIHKDFPDFLKELRIKLGFSRKSLATHLNISSTDYSDFEDKNYFKAPSERQLAKFAEFYGLDIAIFKEKLTEYKGNR